MRKKTAGSLKALVNLVIECLSSLQTSCPGNIMLNTLWGAFSSCV